ncbi:MAG: hypothetical protein KDA79_01150 [Planctomycetaceae bacterium]|nr:hypothetical protein [Planctomycetaceae bacterium]
METRLPFDISPQPDETTCGPTCLHAVYRYHGDPLALEDVLSQTGRLETGGTLAVMLGDHALRRGYRATIYTFNLEVFDPTWFDSRGHSLPADELTRRLLAQRAVKHSPRLRFASDAYVEFLRLGGRIRMRNLDGGLIRRYLKKSIPVLAGLSATWLYAEPREVQPDPAIDRWIPDDINGEPAGHFVILCGYDAESRRVVIADPLEANPFSQHVYAVDLDRVACAILLGIVTFDANLLVIEPARQLPGDPGARSDRDE